MKRRTLSLIISGLLGVIAILSGIYLMAASVTNYIAESKKTDWIVTEARITDVSSRVKTLAAALARLPEQTQEEIFLYYFQHLTQKEIGEQSGWTRSTIGRHIRLALKRLKEEMEVLSHE